MLNKQYHGSVRRLFQFFGLITHKKPSQPQYDKVESVQEQGDKDIKFPNHRYFSSR